MPNRTNGCDPADSDWISLARARMPNSSWVAGFHCRLGAAEIAAARDFLGWNHAPFDIPADIYAEWDAKTDGAVVDASGASVWLATAQPIRSWRLNLNAAWPVNCRSWAADSAKFIAELQANPAKIATRKASQSRTGCLRRPVAGTAMSGSADLAPSNLTIHKSSKSIRAERCRWQLCALW